MREVTRNRRPGLALATALSLIALALTGCGGSGSASTSSRATTSTQTPGVASSGSYRGDGFQISIPSGWQQVARASAATGASGIVFGPPGDTRRSITIHSYRQPTEGIDQTLADVIISDKAEQGTGQMRDVSLHVRSARVPGATQAKELIESYMGPAGRVRYIDVVALAPSGTLITVEAAAPADATGFDPTSAAGSLRISGG